MQKTTYLFSPDAETREIVIASMRDAVDPETGLRPTSVECYPAMRLVSRVVMEFPDPELTTGELIDRWHAGPSDENHRALIDRLTSLVNHRHNGRVYSAHRVLGAVELFVY